VGLHPLPKGSQQCRLRRGWEHGGRRGHDPYRLEEADQVTRSHKQVAIASAGIPQALDPLEVMAIYLKGLHIQRLHAETGAVGPAREAMGAAQQMEDATRLIPLGFKPASTGIEVGTSKSSAIVLEGPRRFEIGGQHAALLHGRP